MRNIVESMSWRTIYNDEFESMERKESGIVSFMKEHIHTDTLIPIFSSEPFTGIRDGITFSMRIAFCGT